LLLALPLVALAHQVRLDALSEMSGRLAGLTLLLTAALSWWSLTRPCSTASELERRSPLVVGLLHGATGAGALVLLLPSVLSGDTVRAALFVVAFALGSMLAMAGLTEAIGRVGRRLSARRLAIAQRVLMVVAAVVGASWLVLG
jgi:hypothetical protein